MDNAEAEGGRRERWMQELGLRAAAHWTDERRRALLGDKHLILPPVESAPLLRVLGLLKGDASMAPDSVRKYMQINRMVAILEPLFLHLLKDAPVVRVVDAGCGSSSLTMLIAWCFRHRWRHPAQILGVDRNREVIDKCRRSADTLLLDDLLRFHRSELKAFDVGETWSTLFGRVSSVPLVHALVSLHACDTATDDALALALAAGAELIAVAPCCQAELARAWSDLAAAGVEGSFSPVWAAPHLRREAAATMTDALRTLLLRGCGYDVTPMEFVPSPHTPKNTLLRAVRRAGPRGEFFEQYCELRDALGGADIKLASVLPSEFRGHLGSRSLPRPQ